MWALQRNSNSDESGDDDDGDGVCVALNRKMYTFTPHTTGFRGRRSKARDALMAAGVSAFDAVAADGAASIAKLCPVCHQMFGNSWVTLLRHCVSCTRRARSGAVDTSQSEDAVDYLLEAARARADASIVEKITMDFSGPKEGPGLLYCYTMRSLALGCPFTHAVGNDMGGILQRRFNFCRVPCASSAYVDRVLRDGERVAHELTASKVRAAPMPYCALAIDGWSHTSSVHNVLHFLNFVVVVRVANGECGMYAWRVVDLGDEKADAETIAAYAQQTIDDIRHTTGKIVSTLVTDGAANVKKARQIVHDNRREVFPRRCAAHALNLLVLDITAAPKTWSYGVLRTAQSIARVAQGTSAMLALLRTTKTWLQTHPPRPPSVSCEPHFTQDAAVLPKEDDPRQWNVEGACAVMKEASVLIRGHCDSSVEPFPSPVDAFDDEEPIADEMGDEPDYYAYLESLEEARRHAPVTGTKCGRSVFLSLTPSIPLVTLAADQDYPSLSLPSVTRWGLNSKLLDSVLLNEDVLRALPVVASLYHTPSVKKTTLGALEEMVNDEATWSSMRALSDVIRPIYRALILLQSSASTDDDMLHVVTVLDAVFDDAERRLLLHTTVVPDCEEMLKAEAARLRCAWVKRRKEVTGVHLHVARFLNPLVSRMSLDADVGLESLLAMASWLYAAYSETHQSAPLDKTEYRKRLEEEAQMYMWGGEPYANVRWAITTSVVAYWLRLRSKSSLLADAALYALSFVATAADAERVWSVFSFLKNPRRNCLAPEKYIAQATIMSYVSHVRDGLEELVNAALDAYDSPSASTGIRALSAAACDAAGADTDDMSHHGVSTVVDSPLECKTCAAYKGEVEYLRGLVDSMMGRGSAPMRGEITSPVVAGASTLQLSLAPPMDTSAAGRRDKRGAEEASKLDISGVEGVVGGDGDDVDVVLAQETQEHSAGGTAKGAFLLVLPAHVLDLDADTADDTSSSTGAESSVVAPQRVDLAVTTAEEVRIGGDRSHWKKKQRRTRPGK